MRKSMTSQLHHQTTSDLINVVIGFGRGFQEGNALATSKLLPSLTLHSPLCHQVTLVANQYQLYIWGSELGWGAREGG